MKTIDQQMEQTKHAIERSQKTSSTVAGPTEASSQKDHGDSNTTDWIDTINQVFSLLRINYHNQFYAAFTEAEQLNSAKKLWLKSLQCFAPSTLLSAAEHIIKTQEYLPTLSKFIDACDQLEYQLPDVRTAYLEACRASSNRSAHQWSHAIVYHAGQSCGWSTLRGEAESFSWPLFKKHYATLCSAVRTGQNLALPALKNTTESEEIALSLEQRKEKLNEIKAML